MIGGDYFMPMIERVRLPRDHQELPLRHLLPLARSVDVDRSQAGGRGLVPGPGQDERQFLRREGLRPRRRHDRQGHRLRRQGTRAGPIPLAAVADASRPKSRPRRGKTAPEGRLAVVRRLRLRLEPLFRHVGQRQPLPQRGQLADRGIRPDLDPAQDPNPRVAPAHPAQGRTDLLGLGHHPARSLVLAWASRSGIRRRAL